MEAGTGRAGYRHLWVAGAPPWAILPSAPVADSGYLAGVGKHHITD